MKKAERVHVNKVAELGCVACFIQFGEWGTPGEIHHLRNYTGIGLRADWYNVICLCVGHHRNSSEGKLAFHEGKQTFERNYGTQSELLLLTLSNI